MEAFFDEKVFLSVYFAGGSLEKDQVVTFFPCVSCAIPHFLAILMTSSDTASSVPGKCSGKPLLREEASRYISRLSQHYSNPWQHEFLREARLRLKKHSGQRQVRSFRSDGLAPWASELPGGSFVVCLGGAGGEQSSVAALLGGGIRHVSTLGDTDTS